MYCLRRYDPKAFVWTRPDGKPWTASRRRRLLYRLPELLAADPGRPVFVVEGEKDVDRLWSLDLVATCNDSGGGKGKWSAAHSRPLRDRCVFVLPDNDSTGFEHARDIAGKLRRVASAVRVVILPDLPKKGDVSGWLDAGHPADELLRRCQQTPLWEESPNYDPVYNQDYLFDSVWARRRIILSDLEANEKLLLIVILDLGPNRPPSQADLAKYLGLTERRVRQLVAQLREKGVLRVYRSSGRNKYCSSDWSWRPWAGRWT